MRRPVGAVRRLRARAGHGHRLVLVLVGLPVLACSTEGPPPASTALPGATALSEPTPATPITTLLASVERERSPASLADLAHHSGGDFGDWRLRVLADHTPERQEREALLAELLDRFASSPLADGAAVELAQLHFEQGDTSGAWSAVAARWARSMDSDLLSSAFAAAPDPGTRLAIATRVAEVAPGLLARLDLYPPALAVAPVEQIRAFAVVGAPLLARAGHLDRARAWLAATAEGEEDLDWHLAAAQVELRGGRARAALAALAGLVGADDDERAAILTTRGEALLALAKSDRPRAQAHTAAALRELEAASRLSSPIAAGASARLIVHADGPRRRAAIRRLAALDPSRREGPRTLLALAFEAIAANEHAVALELLQELLDHPGGGPWHPTASYWSGRQLEALGHHIPARERLAAAGAAAGLYRHLVGSAGGGPANSGTPAPPPSDPQVARAEALFASGAATLALRELDSLGLAPGRDARLRGRILAGSGRIREAALAIRAAYPELGTGQLDRIPEDDLALYYPLRHADAIRSWSAARGVPAALIAAMVRQESAFDERATSRAGARGLLQLMPPTAREVARRERLGAPAAEALYDPELSLRLGTSYFETCLEMFDGEVTLALAAYNAGPYRVRRWRREHHDMPLDLFLETMPIAEPRDYVKRVLQHRDAYTRLAPFLVEGT